MHPASVTNAVARLEHFDVKVTLAYDDEQATLAGGVRGVAHRDADFATMSGIPLEPVYGPDDGEFPGQYPFTRGPYASMYRSKLWTMRMFAGFGTADDTNRRFQESSGRGAMGCRPRSICRR